MAKVNMKSIRCIWCKSDMRVAIDSAAGLCDHCVARLSDPPKQPVAAPVVTPDEKKARKEAKEAKKAAKLQAAKTAKSGKGKGWHFKILFEHDGQWYSKGQPITEAEMLKIRKSLKAKAE